MKKHTLTALLLGALLFILQPDLHAQNSPLTVQPSTGRVGVGTTNPAYPLDVSGTVNAASFRGDGFQLTNLPSASSGVTVLDAATGNLTVTSTSETTLYSFTVPGGTLETGALWNTGLDGILSLQDGGSQVTLRFKYGSTTLASQVIKNTHPDNGVVNRPFITLFRLSGKGAANSQYGTVNFFAQSGAGTIPTQIIAKGTAAIDSTANQTFTVTAQFNSSGNSITREVAKLKKEP